MTVTGTAPVRWSGKLQILLLYYTANDPEKNRTSVSPSSAGCTNHYATGSSGHTKNQTWAFSMT